MRPAAILTIALMFMTLGLIISGCSKNINTANSGDTSSQKAIAGEMDIEQPAENPDIGGLDDSPVSDELPQ